MRAWIYPGARGQGGTEPLPENPSGGPWALLERGTGPGLGRGPGRPLGAISTKVGTAFAVAPRTRSRIPSGRSMPTRPLLRTFGAAAY